MITCSGQSLRSFSTDSTRIRSCCIVSQSLPRWQVGHSTWVFPLWILSMKRDTASIESHPFPSSEQFQRNYPGETTIQNRVMPYFAMCNLHGPNTRPEELQDTSSGLRSEIPFSCRLIIRNIPMYLPHLHFLPSARSYETLCQYYNRSFVLFQGGNSKIF